MEHDPERLRAIATEQIREWVRRTSPPRLLGMCAAVSLPLAFLLVGRSWFAGATGFGVIAEAVAWGYVGKELSDLTNLLRDEDTAPGTPVGVPFDREANRAANVGREALRQVTGYRPGMPASERLSEWWALRPAWLRWAVWIVCAGLFVAGVIWAGPSDWSPSP